MGRVRGPISKDGGGRGGGGGGSGGGREAATAGIGADKYGQDGEAITTKQTKYNVTIQNCSTL